MTSLRSLSLGTPPARRQRGVVLLMSLIILAVLLAAGVALVRSFNTSLFQAGNLAFKRDLANQAEVVTPVVLGYFQGGGALASVADRESNNTAINYTATMLPTNAQGIPEALLAATPPNPITPAGQSVTVYYVIDRMCMSTGDETTLGDRCVGVDYAAQGGAIAGGTINPLRQVNYRVSVRVDGPRSTQAFFQSTLSL